MLTKLYVRATTALRREEGATATEYAVLVAFIAVALTAAAIAFRSSLEVFFKGIGAEVESWLPL